jgi:Flp pilus assembly protein CpaB
VLQANDVRSVTWPQANAPLAAIHEASRALGRPIGGQMSKGEPITTARMLDTTIVSGLTAGQVAATVTLPTAGQAAILLAGAVIDLYLGGAEDSMVNDRPIVAQGTSRLIAPSVRILAVLSVQDATGPQPLSIVLAVDRLTASQLANHPSGPFLATLRRPS